MKKNTNSSQQAVIPGDRTPHSYLWVLPVASYIGPLMGKLLSAYLSGYFLFIFFLIPVIAGIATLILITEAHTPRRRMESKGYSLSAVTLGLINIIAYPLLLLLFYNFFYKDPLG